jgi:hypothetical protein
MLLLGSCGSIVPFAILILLFKSTTDLAENDAEALDNQYRVISANGSYLLGRQTLGAPEECGTGTPNGQEYCPLNVCCSKWGFCGVTDVLFPA